MKNLVLTVTAVVIILVCITGCGGKFNEFDADTFAKISASGLDSKGTITVSVDHGNIQQVYEEIRKDDQKKASSVVDVLGALDFQVMDKQENLSNGDVVKIKANYPEDVAKEAKIKINNTEFTYTVEGLEEAKVIDNLFEEIELIYEGISPRASVEVVNRSEKQFIRDIRYSVSPNSDLRIGDNIIVVAEISEASAESNGYILPDILEKEFIVEGVDEYVKDYNDLDQATINAMKKEALDHIESATVDEYGFIARTLGLNTQLWSASMLKDTKFDDPELTNIYFNTVKQGAMVGYSASNNDIFFAYKIIAHYADETEPRIAYLAMRFYNVIKKADGNTEYSIGEIHASSIGKTLDETYKYVVSSRKKDYEIQEIAP